MEGGPGEWPEIRGRSVGPRRGQKEPSVRTWALGIDCQS